MHSFTRFGLSQPHHQLPSKSLRSREGVYIYSDSTVQSISIVDESCKIPISRSSKIVVGGVLGGGDDIFFITGFGLGFVMQTPFLLPGDFHFHTSLFGRSNF